VKVILYEKWMYSITAHTIEWNGRPNAEDRFRPSVIVFIYQLSNVDDNNNIYSLRNIHLYKNITTKTFSPSSLSKNMVFYSSFRPNSSTRTYVIVVVVVKIQVKRNVWTLNCGRSGWIPSLNIFITEIFIFFFTMS